MRYDQHVIGGAAWCFEKWHVLQRGAGEGVISQLHLHVRQSPCPITEHKTLYTCKQSRMLAARAC